MKSLLILALMLSAVPAQPQNSYVATSVKDFDRKTDNDQVRFIQTFVDRIAVGEARDYKVTPEQIRSYFSDKPGKDLPPDGVAMVQAAAGLLERGARKNAADLSKIDIEDVVQWAIDMKFRVNFP